MNTASGWTIYDNAGTAVRSSFEWEGSVHMTMREKYEVDLGSARPRAYQWLRITSALVLLLVLIQAVFAGRGLWFGGNAIDIHGGIANLTGLVVLAQLVLVFVAGLSGSFRTSLIATNVLLFILVVVQFGLGYGGRDNATAASLHVPNGVLIFGVATVASCLAWLKAPVSDRSV